MNENDGFDHFQHFAGLSYNFGSGDSDKDGIPDKKDKCPDVSGLKEYGGCPDTDGDSIIDKEDKCPEIPGIIELNGCKDSDNDGISDPEDTCPEEAGTIEMNGCPDSDGDNISDIEDECINQVGTIENKGCPWPDSDGDGINDKEDLCKDEVGTKINNGCPELSNEIVKTLNEFGSRINFAANSYKIYGRTSLDNLAKIKILLEENPEGVLMIEGYSSADGNKTYNEELSEKRANAVLEYLIKLGVPAERLEVIGLGVVNPIGDNDNPKGRAINRRVQFKTKQY
jgi:outer membrane protein OmpA-like peptidoglycan-associated protein